MDDVGLGRLIRALRIRRGWRQADLAAAARISRHRVSRLERGHVDSMRLADIRACSSALEVRLPFAPSWRGGDADRIVNEFHTLLQQCVSSRLASVAGWAVLAEVTFSIFGERGAIDLLGWHAASRTMLVVELKSEIVDPGALVRQVDRYRRLAPRIARDRGWEPGRVGVWVAVLDTSMNRRRLAKSAAILRAALPTDGRSIGIWLDSPSGALAALSFVAISHRASTTSDRASIRRVRRPREVPGAHPAGSGHGH